jgi:hypothetical protein
MNGILEELVRRSGFALEAEDRLIMGSATMKGQHGGLLRINNEHYYQGVVWRALLSRWLVKVEVDRHDLVIYDDAEPKTYVTAVEMKRWMSVEGNREISGIKEDVGKLRRATVRNGYLLVFSANPLDRPELTEENMVLLQKDVFGADPPLETQSYAFRTFDEKRRDREFWIIGWRVTGR